MERFWFHPFICTQEEEYKGCGQIQSRKAQQRSVLMSSHVQVLGKEFSQLNQQSRFVHLAALFGSAGCHLLLLGGTQLLDFPGLALVIQSPLPYVSVCDDDAF